MESLGLPDEVFRNALDEHAIVAITDRRGIILEVNQKFCDISGYSRDELIGKTHRLINSHRHDRSFFAEMWATILAGNVWTGEVCNRSKKGDYYWLDATIVPVLAPDGAPTHFIAVRRDITKRKLKAMLDRAILDNAGNSVIATDTTGMITLFNHGAELLLGYQADEVIGQHSPELFHDLSEVVLRAAELSRELGRIVKPGFEAFIAKTLDTHQPDIRDWTYITKSHELKTVSLCVTPLIDSLGHIDGFLGIASDVTELRQSIRQKQESANRLSKIASQVPGMVYQFVENPNGQSYFPYVSEGIRTVYRLSPEDVATSADLLLQRILPDDLPHVLETIQVSKETLSKWQQEYRIQLPEKEIRWLSASAIPERLDDGTVLWSGFTSDVTERKQADEQLLQASLHDPLTGLHNRLFGDMEISRLRSGRRFPLSILVVDLDGLKLANDRHGHLIGDQFIQSAANAMKTCFRPEDLIVRMGGDEFLIILPESSEENTLFAKDRLRTIVSQTPPICDGVYLNLSIGSATAHHTHEFEHALKAADAAMYADKAARKMGRQ